jgi:hypothetical protein
MFVAGALVLFTLFVIVGETLVLFKLFVFVGGALVLFTLASYLSFNSLTVYYNGEAFF